MLARVGDEGVDARLAPANTRVDSKATTATTSDEKGVDARLAPVRKVEVCFDLEALLDAERVDRRGAKGAASECARLVAAQDLVEEGRRVLGGHVQLIPRLVTSETPPRHCLDTSTRAARTPPRR